jgi:hypothetical protein
MDAHNLFGEIRSARERGAHVEALQRFVELPCELRENYAAALALGAEQLTGVEQAVAYLATLEPDANGERDPKAVMAAVWSLEKQPAGWATRCQQALRAALEASRDWRLVCEAAHVGHYVIDTEDLGELDEEPDGMAWGEYETRWFAPCEPGTFGVVSRVVVETDEHSKQRVVALPCAGGWMVWKQR